MKNIVNAPFVEEMRKTTANMYRLGWDERNGGNISCLLDTDKVAEYLDINEVKRTIPLGFDADPLIGKSKHIFDSQLFLRLAFLFLEVCTESGNKRINHGQFIRWDRRLSSGGGANWHPTGVGKRN